MLISQGVPQLGASNKDGVVKTIYKLIRVKCDMAKTIIDRWILDDLELL